MDLHLSGNLLIIINIYSGKAQIVAGNHLFQYWSKLFNGSHHGAQNCTITALLLLASMTSDMKLSIVTSTISTADALETIGSIIGQSR